MPSRPEHSPWLTLALVAQMALGLLAMTVTVPSMLDWPATLGASTAQVQLTFSAYVAFYGLMQLVFGPLSDRRGRRPVLLAGLWLALAGAVLGAAATDLWTLVAARVLQGAGGAASIVVGRAMIQDLFHGPQRTRMMAVVGMTMGVCPPLAMLVGGQLHVHWGWQSNFVLLALMTVALLLLSSRTLPAPPQARAAPAPVLQGYVRLLASPTFVLYVFMLASTASTFYTFLAGAPLVLGHYGVLPQQLGLYVMAVPLSYIVGNVLTTRWIGRLGERGLMGMGQALALLGLGLVLLLALLGWHTPMALALPLMLVGLGHGLLVPPTLAGTVGLLPALAGSAAALAGVMQQASGSLGGYVVALVPHDSAANLAWMMLGWTVLGLLAQGLLWQRGVLQPASR